MAKSENHVKLAVPVPEDYFALANQIAWSAHDLSVMQARVVYLMMCQVRPEDTDLSCIEMKVGDILRALNMSDQGNRYNEIKAAIKGAMGKIIDLETPDGWVMFPWFMRAWYYKARDVIRVQFADELKPFILNMKDRFHIHMIADIAKLQGRYALRLYEMAMSYEGMAGKGGNKPGEWYLDLQFDYLRHIFGIGDNQYKAKKDLRVYVVDNPVREINEAGIGIRIDCDYDKWRRGRRLDGVRLLCRLVGRDEPRPVHPATAAERDAQGLREKYPDEWERLCYEELLQPPLPFVSVDVHRFAAEGRADERLAAAHADEIKKPGKPKTAKKKTVTK
jgi:hypothetical protein